MQYKTVLHHLQHTALTSWVVQALPHLIHEPHRHSVARPRHKRGDDVICRTGYKGQIGRVHFDLKFDNGVVETHLLDWTKKGGVFRRTLDGEKRGEDS